MHTVLIAGAGQLGSRHLQALKGVETPLDIHVVEPQAASSQTARERYDAVASAAAHRISFHEGFASLPAVDVAIVATNADVRRGVVEALFGATRVRSLVLEKLLFPNREDYDAVGELLARNGARAWVNCPMRVIPVYERIRGQVAGARLLYRVTGGQYGLVTNAIHYIDHVVHLTGCESFELDLDALDEAPVKSKRPGFLELTGTLVARFADRTFCEVTSLSTGTAPVVVEISTDRHRFISRETEGRLWSASEASKWAWEESDAPIPYQSQLTTGIVRGLLATGECGLTPFDVSARTHVALLDPLAAFVRSRSPGIRGYPFT